MNALWDCDWKGKADQKVEEQRPQGDIYIPGRNMGSRVQNLKNALVRRPNQPFVRPKLGFAFINSECQMSAVFHEQIGL